MAGFLYHIPGERQPTAEALEAVGFALSADAALPGGACDQGPAGAGGCVFTTRCRNTPKVGYWPDSQTWQRFGGFWLGYENDSPPTPGDLLRGDAIDGHPVKLGDGQEWNVPVIRELAGRIAVEQKVGWSDDGERIIFRPIPKFRRIVDIVLRVWETLDDMKAEPVPDSELLELCVLALITNYVVEKPEIDLLGLITTENAIEIVQATVDVPTLRKMEQVAAEMGIE